MKKLITICLILFALGCGMGIAGAFAGGELYGSYYDGALHSVRESLWDAGEFIDSHVRDGLRFREWRDDGGYHSGWFFDDDDDRSFSVVGWDKVYVPDIDDVPAPDIRKLELSFDGGDYRIVEGDEFDCSGAIVRKSEMHGGTWELSLRRKNSTETTITLPEMAFDKLECNIGAASLTIDIPLAVEKAEFNIGAGELFLNEPLDAAKIEVECGLGNASLQLTGQESDYGYEVAASMGSVTLNGNELAGGLAGTYRSSSGGSRKLELNVGAGTIDVTTQD